MENKMNELNETGELKQFIIDAKKAKENQSLFCFIGAGVSISQLYPDWDTYVTNLIDFWIYKLNDVANDDRRKTKKCDVDQLDMRFLKLLNQSKLSNKRKVDLVDHIIKSYCTSDEKRKESELRYEYSLSYEKYIFTSLRPIIPHNTILEEIVKLRPIFLTTNYDNEIEKTYTRVLGDVSYSSKDFSEIPSKITSGMVLHLHGVPETQHQDLFISSSQSYSNLYFRDKNGYIKKLQGLLTDKKDALVLFIGCSMEEEEVLSIFNFRDVNIKYYALMKYNEVENAKVINDYYNSIIKDFYNSNKGINFIWYGTEFSKLTESINHIVNDILYDVSDSHSFLELRKVMLDV